MLFTLKHDGHDFFLVKMKKLLKMELLASTLCFLTSIWEDT